MTKCFANKNNIIIFLIKEYYWTYKKPVSVMDCFSTRCYFDDDVTNLSFYSPIYILLHNIETLTVLKTDITIKYV